MTKKVRVGKNRIIYIKKNNPTLSLGIPQLGWSANSLPPQGNPHTHLNTDTLLTNGGEELDSEHFLFHLHKRRLSLDGEQ